MLWPVFDSACVSYDEGAVQSRPNPSLKVKVKFLKTLELLPATPQKPKKTKTKTNNSAVFGNASFLKHQLRSCCKAYSCKYQALLKLLLSW